MSHPQEQTKAGHLGPDSPGEVLAAPSPLPLQRRLLGLVRVRGGTDRPGPTFTKIGSWDSIAVRPLADSHSLSASVSSGSSESCRSKSPQWLLAQDVTGPRHRADQPPQAGGLKAARGTFRVKSDLRNHRAIRNRGCTIAWRLRRSPLPDSNPSTL